jgi:hypothetical protein
MRSSDVRLTTKTQRHKEDENKWNMALLRAFVSLWLINPMQGGQA